MARKILVLFDTVNIRKEVVRYAIGLAKRTESDLAILMILHPNSRENSVSQDAIFGDALNPHLSDIEREGVKVNAEVLIGDPPSELLKFLARNASFQTVIWGGAATAVKGKWSKAEGHWLGQVKNMIGCPIVVPSLRSDAR